MAALAVGAQVYYSPLRATLIEYHAASDVVRAALKADICHDETIERFKGFAELPSDKDRDDYVDVRESLERAYAKSKGTDGAREQVRSDFCAAASKQ